MEERIKKIELEIGDIKEFMIKMNNNIEVINNKINILIGTMDNDLIPECKKMGGHIDFIETIYDKVKYPLGYLCNRIKTLTNKNNNNYTLIDN